MKERIDRQTDENLYQPKIHSERIRELHALREISGLPMTVLVDMAIRELIEKGNVSQGIIYEQNNTEESEFESILTKAYTKGYEDGMRDIWLNVVDPLLGVNIALNRGERKEATEQLRILDLWIKENLKIKGEDERNREGIIKRA